MFAAIVFAGNQLPVPSQKRIGRDDRGHFSKQATAELLGFGCQASTLIVAETKPLVSELLGAEPDFLPGGNQ
jgi:hypothetical protein